VGQDLLAILADARSDADAAGDEHQAPPRLDETEKKLLKPMQAIVAAAGKTLGVLPEVIASRKELAAALHGERNLRVFRGWRRGLVGEKLLELLER